MSEYKEKHPQCRVQDTDISGKPFDFLCDCEIAELLRNLNILGVRTLFSCCGKNRRSGYVLWRDDFCSSDTTIHGYAQATVMALNILMARFGKIQLERKFNEKLKAVTVRAGFEWREENV